MSVSRCWGGGLKYYGKYKDTHLIVFLGAELDERRVNFLVDGTTHVHDKRIDEIDGGWII